MPKVRRAIQRYRRITREWFGYVEPFPPPGGGRILREDGSFVLREDASKVLRED